MQYSTYILLFVNVNIAHICFTFSPIQCLIPARTFLLSWILCASSLFEGHSQPPTSELLHIEQVHGPSGVWGSTIVIKILILPC